MNNKSNIKTICSFYKFKQISEIEKIKKEILSICNTKDIMGTILIAKEGINGTISGDNNSINSIREFLINKISSDIFFKISFFKKHPFLRMKVKIKHEIIKLSMGEIPTSLMTGTFVKPINWNNFIENDDVILVDTRNDYESEIGSFKKSITPKTKSFCEFPDWIKKNKESIKNKKIALFCTGGVRCEKASAFLLKEGYKNIYQLDGGIINYLEKVKKKESKWEGECFVFDERVSVNHSLKKGNYIQCFACRSALSEIDINSKFYSKGISCPKCYKNTTKIQKRKFNERQKQINLANQKGEKHLGKKYAKK